MNELKKEGEGEYIDRNSKFLAFAVSIDSEEEAMERMRKKRAEHPKANHLCYAYRFKEEDKIIENLSDDGEPTHSAGQPILRQIRSEDLINCLVMVIRYFGGVKLGVGGLMKAYKNAAKIALEKAEKIAVIPTKSIHFKVDYQDWGKVMAFLDKENLPFELENETTNAKISLKVKLQQEEVILEQLAHLPIVLL